MPLPQNGYLTIPELPGLGLVLDLDRRWQDPSWPIAEIRLESQQEPISVHSGLPSRTGSGDH